MISYSAALEIVLAAARALPQRLTAPEDALGLAAAAEVRSAVAVPSFDNAAVDGFALRSVETRAASAQAPARFQIAGERIAAGDPPPPVTPAGCAWEIMTGACMPADCDAVVPVERAAEVAAATRTIEISEPLAPGENRRRSGEDFLAGAVLLAPGDLLTPQAVMALSAVGCDEIMVRAAPRVGVIATGSELVASGLPQAATIRDTNLPYLAASLRSLGLSLAARRMVADDPDELGESIAAAAESSDMVLTTGGVSAGRLDFVPATVARLGGEILFHKVAIRPGKPILCARLPGGKLLFGLPGNPMAVAVGLRFFVVPAIRALLGRAPECLPCARTTARIRKREALTFFAKAVTRATREATLEVTALPGQESFKISPLLRANSWAVVPEGIGEVAAGDVLRVAPLLPAEFPLATGSG